jgi:hypothetical protein
MQRCRDGKNKPQNEKGTPGRAICRLSYAQNTKRHPRGGASVFEGALVYLEQMGMRNATLPPPPLFIHMCVY